MKKKLKIGILGAGRIGKMHSENITKYINTAEVKAIADIKIDEMSDWVREIGISCLTNNPYEILDDPKIDKTIL